MESLLLTWQGVEYDLLGNDAYAPGCFDYGFKNYVTLRLNELGCRRKKERFGR